MATVTLHPLQRLFYAEDLVRLRRSDEKRRYAAPQRGGRILADEVGLGKTIEAGLVIAQLRSEGARRILLVMPKPLLGQWRQELFQLFGIEARDGGAEAGAYDGDGIYLVGREAAGSER